MVKNTDFQIYQQLYFAEKQALQKFYQKFTPYCRNSAAKSQKLRQFGGILVSAFESRGPGPLVCHCNARFSVSSTCNLQTEKKIRLVLHFNLKTLLSLATAPF